MHLRISLAASLVLTALLGASSVAVAAEDPPPPAASAFDAATPVQQELYRKLSVRDPVPTCAELDAMTEQPVEDLLFLVDNAIQPPWVGMRAATCLTQGHTEAALPQLQRWVATPELKGLAILVVKELDQLPLPAATAISRSALEGPLRATLEPRILKHAVPELTALVKEIPAPAGPTATPQ